MEKTCLELFGIDSNLKFDVPELSPELAPYVPKLDEDYVFREEELKEYLAWGLAPFSNEGLWVFGPTGSGKTTLAEQVHARLKKPLVVIQCSKLESLDDILYRIEAGAKFDEKLINYVPVDLALAIQNGWTVLFDEGDVLHPSLMVTLNGLLQGSPLSVPKLSSEPLVPAKGFRIIVTANTGGEGDNSGLYQGTRSHNAATRNRFVKLPVGYPAKTAEMQILAKRFPSLGRERIEFIVDLANDIREQYVGDATRDTDGLDYSSRLTAVLSVRTNLMLAHYSVVFMSFYKDVSSDEERWGLAFKRALQRVVLDGGKASDKEAILRLVELKGSGNTSANTVPF